MRRSSASRWEAAFLGCALLLLGARAARAASISVGVTGSLTNVLPASPGARARIARVEAARGEWESFQVVIRAEGEPALVRGVTATPLAGPGGSPIPAPRASRVEAIELRVPSSVEGHPGSWPDLLIPAVDAYVGEARRAFPLVVPAGEARSVWMDLFVPRSARPGRYVGTFAIDLAKGGRPELQVELQVHRFALPVSSSLPVSFGLTGPALQVAHPGLDPEALAALLRRYALAALRHRISVHGGSMEPAPWTIAPGGELEIDWAEYDAEVAPFLDGTADPGGPAEGARWTAIDLRLPARLEGRARARYARLVVEHFRAHGWLDRLFHYTADEPGPEALGEVAERASALRRVVPEVPRLVTHTLAPELLGSVDIWCPVVNQLEDRPSLGQVPHPPRSAYADRLARGERLWWYQSCMSHGCSIVGRGYFTGWPSYAIDAPPVAQRVLEWLTFRYEVGGELYYNTVEAYARRRDPRREPSVAGGNGDGTLFYAGRASEIGGRTEVPLESLRLRRIRDGLEDLEYLRLHAHRFGRARTQAWVLKVARRSFDWEHDPERLLSVRSQIAREIDQRP